MKKKAKSQAVVSEVHQRLCDQWNQLFKAVSAVVQRGIDSAMPAVLERAETV